MSAPEKADVPQAGEREWRNAIVEVEQARMEYAKQTPHDDEDNRAVGRRWLRLWRAERRRDELIRTSD